MLIAAAAGGARQAQAIAKINNGKGGPSSDLCHEAGRDARCAEDADSSTSLHGWQ
jgi:hypothetical protein